MKQETFKVESESLPLLEAFEKELQKAGITVEESSKGRQAGFRHWIVSISLNGQFPIGYYQASFAEINFTLPEDWHKALEFVKKQYLPILGCNMGLDTSAINHKNTFNPRVGDWAALPITGSLFVFKITDLKFNRVMGFGYDLSNSITRIWNLGENGRPITTTFDLIKIGRYATPKEVKQALIEICKEKDLFGKRVKEPIEGGQEATVSEDSVFYFVSTDALIARGICLYRDGKFAEPAEDENYIMPELLNIKKDFDELINEINKIKTNKL